MCTRCKELAKKLRLARGVKEKQMTELEAAEIYWKARCLLQALINGGQRGSKDEILEELESDLE